MTDQMLHVYNDILMRLAAVRRKENIAMTLHGALLSGVVVLGGCLLALLVEETFRLEVLPRTIIFWLLVLLGIGLLLWLVVRPLLRFFSVLPDENTLVTAGKVGRAFPTINDHLVNALQLFGQGTDAQLYSRDLINASFEDVRKEIEALDFTSVVDYTAPRRISKVFAVTAAVAVLLFGVFPSAFFGSAFRLLNYSQAFATPLPYHFIVEPGDKEVVKGESVTIRVRVEGEPQQHILLLSKPEGQIEYETRSLKPTADGSFTDEIRSLKLTTTYHVSSGVIRSKEYTLTVIDRPVVKNLRVHIDFPAYSQIPPKQLDDNIGDVTALKGSRITVSLETNKEVSSAMLMFNDSTHVELATSGKRTTGSLVLMKERTYHVALRDSGGVTNADPIEYTMKLIPDAYPTASILLPGRNLDIAENVQLNLLFKITDDYGFSKLRLAYKLVQSRYENPAQEFSSIAVPVPSGMRTEATIPHLWSLSDLHLAPEDVVSYYVEVFDNDNVSGPKSALSEIFSLRLPSLEEVFADVDKGHEMSLDAMKEAMKDAQTAKKELDELQQEMKKGQQKMNWQDQKKGEEVVKKYEEIRKKLEEVNKTVEQMVNEMQKNRLLSQETIEKYQELQQLMEQMNSPEFADAMKKLQQALQQMNPNEMKQALQQFSFSEENFRRSLERTINLLKRIQIEQKVDETLKRAEEMMKQQENLEKQAERTNPQDKEKLANLAQQQKELGEQLERMKQQLADLQKRMEEFPAEMPLSEMQKAMDELQQSGLDEQMKQIAQEMLQQQLQQAQEGQKNALQKMGRITQRLQQMQQALRQNQQRQVMNAMRRTLQDLLELSKRQEALKKEAQGMEANSQGFRENAEQQMEILRDLANVANSMSRLAQKTFSVTPEMGKSIGDAFRQMGEAMQALEQRDGGTAGRQQAGAMASLNEAAQKVQSAMNAMMQGGGQGLGMAAFMQRLQQLTGMQQGINQGTQNLGGLSQEQAAEMARLAGEQGMVRKSLEQLAKEAENAGQLSKILGDLNRVAQDMREVQTDLAQGNVNPETLHKQERILSRLLDSQRSARERDYEKRRRAESGKDRVRESPGQIDVTSQDSRNRLRQDMLKAMEEGYSRDYQELIRKYFEALEQPEKQP